MGDQKVEALPSSPEISNNSNKLNEDPPLQEIDIINTEQPVQTNTIDDMLT